MLPYTKWHVPDSIWKFFLKCYQVLSQLSINGYIRRMNFTAHQMTFFCVVSWLAAIDSVTVIKPEIIDMQIIQCISIFLAASGYNGGGIHVTNSHRFVNLESKWTET